MVFQISNIGQILGWVLVFACIIILNELGRKTRIGGIILFVIIPVLLTVYYILAHVGLFGGKTNPTVAYMDGWFHYFKLYAAVAGCIGFMMIKYQWGIGKKKWFKWFPWFIVTFNIVIAIVSELESFLAALSVSGKLSGAWWASDEGVFLFGGWWNILNALAGLINIFCMTGCAKIYFSKDKRRSDMLWPDMTLWFIATYSIWSFTYTYLNLPTHAWYCGFALLLAPTVANALWNRGAWIQNRINTLAIWCMWVQTVPLFQLQGTFAAALPSLYGGASANGVSAMDLYEKAIALFNAGQGKTAAAGEAVASMGITANPQIQGIVAILSVCVNLLCITVILTRSRRMKRNPYTNWIFHGTKLFEDAMARAAV